MGHYSSHYSIRYLSLEHYWGFKLNSIEMSLKMVVLLPLLALVLIVSDVDAGALRAVRCPGTADVGGCDGGECQVTCSGGQVKTLHCDTNTYYTKTRGRATLVICKTEIRRRG